MPPGANLNGYINNCKESLQQTAKTNEMPVKVWYSWFECDNLFDSTWQPLCQTLLLCMLTRELLHDTSKSECNLWKLWHMPHSQLKLTRLLNIEVWHIMMERVRVGEELLVDWLDNV